jgi:hypothetical protein
MVRDITTAITMKSLLSPLILILCTFTSYGADEILYVFYPLTTRPQQVQELLQKSLDDAEVTVFGRVNDLSARVAAAPPDAILAKPLLLKQFDSYTIASNGIRNGSPEETYIIVSIDKPIEIESVHAETVIGVIDILGRNAMKTFIHPLFPSEPRLKQVTKVEDLLPLLTFSMADGIMIEEVFLPYFKRTSNLSFKTGSPIKPKSGIIALAYRNDIGTRKIAKKLAEDNLIINKLFEIEKWK